MVLGPQFIKYEMKLIDQLKESIKLKFNLSKSELNEELYIAKDFQIENLNFAI